VSQEVPVPQWGK